ncbi:unnamed protein product [Closterium sp. NIES-65]|nr:unnamed protein product [Closterium sp. NIES-65]
MRFKAILTTDGVSLLEQRHLMALEQAGKARPCFLPAFERIGRVCHVYLTPSDVFLLHNVLSADGVQAIAQFPTAELFSEHLISSASADRIAFSLDLSLLARALRSSLATAATRHQLKLVKKSTNPTAPALPFLSLEAKGERSSIVQDIPISTPLPRSQLIELQAGIDLVHSLPETLVWLPDLPWLRKLVERLQRIGGVILPLLLSHSSPSSSSSPPTPSDPDAAQLPDLPSLRHLVGRVQSVGVVASGGSQQYTSALPSNRDVLPVLFSLTLPPPPPCHQPWQTWVQLPVPLRHLVERLQSVGDVAKETGPFPCPPHPLFFQTLVQLPDLPFLRHLVERLQNLPSLRHLVERLQSVGDVADVATMRSGALAMRTHTPSITVAAQFKNLKVLGANSASRPSRISSAVHTAPSVSVNHPLVRCHLIPLPSVPYPPHPHLTLLPSLSHIYPPEQSVSVKHLARSLQCYLTRPDASYCGWWSVPHLTLTRIRSRNNLPRPTARSTADPP